MGEQIDAIEIAFQTLDLQNIDDVQIDSITSKTEYRVSTFIPNTITIDDIVASGKTGVLKPEIKGNYLSYVNFSKKPKIRKKLIMRMSFGILSNTSHFQIIASPSLKKFAVKKPLGSVLNCLKNTQMYWLKNMKRQWVIYSSTKRFWTVLQL